MYALGLEASRLLQHLDADYAKHRRVEQYKDAYARAVESICRGDGDMAAFVLSHTNGVYLRADGAPRKGRGGEERSVLCEIYIDDPLVRSELNSYREQLRIEMSYRGVTSDELRILPSRFGMKERHPFEGRYLDSREDGERYDRCRSVPASDGKAEDDVRVRRAFCLVFGENAADILAGLDALELHLSPGSMREGIRQRSRWHTLTLRTGDAGLAKQLEDGRQALQSAARTLGLNLSEIRVLTACG